MDGLEKYCKRCKWYKKDTYCKAYPDGIPEQILNGELVHDTPWKQADRPFIFEEENKVQQYQQVTKQKEQTSFSREISFLNDDDEEKPQKRRGRPSKS